MTRRSEYRQSYAPRIPLWMWLGFASRNARRGIIFGAFLGLLIRAMLRLATFGLRALVRAIELVFRVSKQTALAMVLSFLAGVLVGVLLLGNSHGQRAMLAHAAASIVRSR